MLMGSQPGLKEPILRPKIAVVVLAGGKSSRMGQDKALLPATGGDVGETLLDRACSLGGKLLGELGFDRDSLFVSGEYPPRKCIGDRIPNRGPLGGIHAALATIRESRSGHELVLFLPVDMPALESATLRRMFESIGEARAAHFRGFELPALIRVDVETEELLVTRLDAANSDPALQSVRNLLETLKANAIETSREEEREFVNMNTVSDVEQWRGVPQ